MCRLRNFKHYIWRGSRKRQKGPEQIQFWQWKQKSKASMTLALLLAGGDNLEPRMRKPCAATISIFRVFSLHMFLQLFVLALNRFEAICQGRIDIELTSQYHLQIVLCPLELILILLSSLFVCRNTFPVGWHPHQPK